MRNFILFIRRFFNLILFIAVEIVCVVMISKTSTLQGNDIVSSANTISGLVYKKQSNVLYYFGLRKMNDSLISENAFLRKQLDALRTVDTLKDTIVTRDIGPVDTTRHMVKFAEYIYRTAKVINNSTNASNNYITIDRGSADGISKNMAVISGTGIVGRVEHVSDHYASVLTVLSTKWRVSAKLKDGTNGYVSWDEKQPNVLVMTDVPQQTKIKKGDSVYTAMYSMFSPDILIGTVVKTAIVKKTGNYLIYLHSSTNFHNLQYVYVIENKMEGERRKVEDSSMNKNK